MFGKSKEELMDSLEGDILERRSAEDVERHLHEHFEKELDKGCRKMDRNPFRRSDCRDGRFSIHVADQNKRRLQGLYNKQVLETCVNE